MNEIRLTRPAVQLAASATAAGQPEQLVAIEAKQQAAVLTVAIPRRIARISAAAPGTADAGPLLLPGEQLARAALAVLPTSNPREEALVQIMPLAPEMAAVIGPAGTPSTVAIVQQPMPDATGVIDATEGEAASGMTRAVAVVPADYLRQVADAAESIGSTAVEMIFAPRFGSMLAAAEAAGVTATIVISTDARDLLDRPAEPAPTSSPITFTVKASAPRRGRRPKPPPCPFEDEELPF